jgi:hypothetical protein
MMEYINIVEILQKNWYIFLFMGIFIVGSIVYNIVRLKNTKSSNKNFLAEHPDAAKIFLTTKALITSEAVTVFEVDGVKPQYFFEGGKSGLYVIPGKRTLQMSYTFSRPGIMHRTVTKTYGPATKELLTEANKSYLLGFDREEETFTFSELNT